MRVHHLQVSLGTSSKGELADFYSRLLNADVQWRIPPKPGEKEGEGYTHLDAPTETGNFRINFEYDEHWQPPVWPSKPGKNNMTQHLCIFVYDVNEAESFAHKCGAALDTHQFDENIRVMRDPQGHPFCLIKVEDQ